MRLVEENPDFMVFYVPSCLDDISTCYLCRSVLWSWGGSGGLRCLSVGSACVAEPPPTPLFTAFTSPPGPRHCPEAWKEPHSTLLLSASSEFLFGSCVAFGNPTGICLW